MSHIPAMLAWGTVVFAFLAITLFVRMFPQQGTVDYLEAAVYNSRGAEAFQQNDLNKAEQEFRSATLLKPKWAKARLNLGWTLYNEGKLDEAVPELKETLRIDPSMLDGRLALGFVYLGQGNNTAAVDEFGEFLKHDGNNASAYRGLGFAYFWQGNYDSAEVAFKKAIDLNPDDGEVRACHGA